MRNARSLIGQFKVWKALQYITASLERLTLFLYPTIVVALFRSDLQAPHRRRSGFRSVAD